MGTLTVDDRDYLEPFVTGLFSEHLQEASVCYMQRQKAQQAPKRPWHRVEKTEHRLESRINALLWGGKPALAVCQEHATEADPGEFYAALRVFMAANDADVVLELLRSRCVDDQEMQEAAIAALRDATTGPWQKLVAQRIMAEDEALWPLIARQAGYLRLPIKRWLMQVAGTQNPAALDAIWALGRLRSQEAAPLLKNEIEGDDDVRRITALRALVLLGDQDAPAVCENLVEHQSEAWLLLGMCGRQASAELLMSKAPRGELTEDQITGLAMTGEVESIELLMQLLNVEEQAGSAASGLQLLTGADLTEEIFVAEEVSQEELFPEEIELLERGGQLHKPDGSPLGSTETVISTNAVRWALWWRNNRDRFKRRVRYRAGKPFGPGVLLETIENANPKKQRQLAFEEWVARYELPLSFDTSMTVEAQRRFLQQARAWAANEGSQFRSGGWYFGGLACAG